LLVKALWMMPWLTRSSLLLLNFDNVNVGIAY
jgi:hypothetical protein